MSNPPQVSIGSPGDAIASAAVGSSQNVNEQDDSIDMTAEDNRFVAELEFVSCLANPKYLGHLASLTCKTMRFSANAKHSFVCVFIVWVCVVTSQASAHMRHRTFESQEFLDYLKYLLYWKQPEYARYIKCVTTALHCLRRVAKHSLRRKLCG